MHDKLRLVNNGRPAPPVHHKTKTERYTKHFCISQYGKVDWLAGCETTSKHYCWPFLYPHYFAQPKEILVSALFCTTKGRSCIYTISYSKRAFLYLYYFLQPKSILVFVLFCTTTWYSWMAAISYNQRFPYIRIHVFYSLTTLFPPSS